MDTQENGAAAILEIERLTKEAHKTTVLDVKGERPGTYFLVGPDGTASKQVADPAWHGETLATPAELRRFMDDHQAKGGAVFYDQVRAIYVFDINDRRDRALCELKTSPQYNWLAQCSGKDLSQPDFVRLLRITFRGCIAADNNILGLIRNLKFNAGTTGEANIQHARESIQRSVLAQVTGESAVPEELLLRVPVFENHVFAAPVLCAIEVFPHSQTFRLTPYPLEVTNAMEMALSDVAAVLEGDGEIPVYRGQP